MRYIGGKYRIRKELVDFLLDAIGNSNCFVEPFCGSCNIVYSVMADNELIALPSEFKLILNDYHKDLMMMWKAIVYDNWIPPDNCTREEYEKLRKAEPSALRGFVGHGCSFGGIWFSQFAEDKNDVIQVINKKKEYDEENLLFDLDEFGEEPEPIIKVKEKRNYCLNAKNSIMAVAACLKKYDTELYNKSYDELEIPDGSVVYCDPPYIGTAKPGSGNEFDHEKFWEWVRKVSLKNQVFVSEYVAPDDFESVYEINVELDMNREKRTERLFKYKN